MRVLFTYLLLLSATSTFTLRAADLVNGVAVIVNDSIITYEDVQQDLGLFIPMLEQRYGQNPRLFQEQLGLRQKEVTERLVERQLILEEFKSSKFEFPEAIVDEIVQREVKEKYGNRTTLTKTLQAQGKNFESFRQDIKDRVIERELRSINVAPEKIVISPHKMENYYVNHREKYQVGDQVKLRMIVLNQAPDAAPNRARELANQILNKIKEGALFAEMAAIYSEGAKKSEGGDYGWIESTTLIRGLTDVAFSLDQKQTSPVVGVARTGEGASATFWIYRYESADNIAAKQYDREGKVIAEKSFTAQDTLPAIPKEYYLLFAEEKRNSYTKPLAEVRDEIELELRRQEVERLNKRWIERLKKKAFIRYF